MARIKIQPLYDSNDCETCGGGTDHGGRIWIDGELIWEKIPVGYCYDNDYFSDVDFYKIILEHLGYTVEEIEQ